MALRLGKIAMIIGLGYLTLVVGMSYVLFEMMPVDTSSPSTYVYDYGAKGNPYVGFGTDDHQAPRELAIAVSKTGAIKVITGQSLTDLPMVSSGSERERTAVETMKAYTFKNLIGLLLVTTDLGSKTRPSTPAVLAQLLIDDASCLADNEPKVFDSAADGHPSKSATSDRGCDERFEFCYESCLVGFWNRPAPGACHMVCTIMKETCERCTEKLKHADGRWIMQWLYSLASSTQSWFSVRLATNTMMWTFWTLWALCLLQTVDITFWIGWLKAKLSASGILVEVMANTQAEQSPVAVDHKPAESEVDQEPAVNEGPEDNTNNDEGVADDQPVAEVADVSKEPEVGEESAVNEGPENNASNDEGVADDQPVTEEARVGEELEVGEEPAVDEDLEVGEDPAVDEGPEDSGNPDEGVGGDQPVAEEARVDEELKVGEEHAVDEELEVGEEPAVDEELEVGEDPAVDEGPEDSDNHDEGVGGDQPVAEEADGNEGLVAMGCNFIIGWTTDRLQELDIPPF